MVGLRGSGTSAPRSSRGRRATSHGRGAPATGTGGSGPRPEGPRRRRNFFEPRMHKNCTENTIFGHCAPRHRHAPNPILGRILGANLRRSGSAGGGRKIGMCLWQTPKDRPQMVSKCGTLTCNFTTTATCEQRPRIATALVPTRRSRPGSYQGWPRPCELLTALWEM